MLTKRQGQRVLATLRERGEVWMTIPSPDTGKPVRAKIVRDWRQLPERQYECAVALVLRRQQLVLMYEEDRRRFRSRFDAAYIPAKHVFGYVERWFATARD